ncbi:MAG: hypothetical protein M1818_000592 [Claussenomyces sp. TS43310]|nr:MAG: hypothetical protein M1818_000592 [Claussenomyces sp. TS43310]
MSRPSSPVALIDPDSVSGDVQPDWDYADKGNPKAIRLRSDISPHPQKVLDIGTGSGHWAIGFAEKYSSAEVIGVDICPPELERMPANMRVVMDNINEMWTYKPETFDLIHVRDLSGSIYDWQEFYKCAYRCLKPGSWINQVEVSTTFKSLVNPITSDHVLSQWSSALIEAGERAGKTVKIAELARQYIENAGFSKVEDIVFPVPVGAWAAGERQKEIGRLNLAQLTKDLEGLALRPLTKAMKCCYTEVQEIIQQVEVALKQSNKCIYSEM